MSATAYMCAECGHSAPKWFGRCPACRAWGTVDEPGGLEDTVTVATLVAPGPPRPRITTGMGEVDRVLGGGIVPGSAVLLAGEPGIGKSTLVLQLMDGLGRKGARSLLVSGEESLDQVALRARRLGLEPSLLRAACTTSLDAVLAAARQEEADVLIVDSIQTLSDPRLEQAPGSTTQVRECAGTLVRFAKLCGTAVVLVGHVTKDGAVAGPKTMEHVVDVVLTLEGDRGGTLRLLRGHKNRYGTCDESGVFVMGDKGLGTVEDPSALLLEDRRPESPGSVVFPGLEGTRALLVEIQALVTKAPAAPPRRVALGLDSRRLTLLTAVLSEKAQVRLGDKDVFVAATGGIGVREPAADLSICLAIASAARGTPVPERTIAVGEVGLAGEIRRVPGVTKRLAEAARLGFDTALVPRSIEHAHGMQVVKVSSIVDALGAMS